MNSLTTPAQLDPAMATTEGSLMGVNYPEIILGCVGLLLLFNLILFVGGLVYIYRPVKDKDLQDCSSTG